MQTCGTQDEIDVELKCIFLKLATKDEGGDAAHLKTNLRNTVIAGEWLIIAIIDTLEVTVIFIPANFAIHPYKP